MLLTIPAGWCLGVAQLHAEKLDLTLPAVVDHPTFVPVNLGLFARLELQGHENLFAARSNLLDIPEDCR